MMLTSREMNSLDRSAFSVAACKMDQHQPDAAVVGRALDLREAVGGRRIDSGHELEVEHQKPAFRVARQQRLDVLVETVGRTEEQIALQVQALDRAAMRGEHRQLLAGAIERASIFGTVERELDGIDARGAQGKCRAADHDADQDAGNKAPFDNDDDDREQRQVIGEGEPPPRLNDPFVKLHRRRDRSGGRRARISACSRAAPAQRSASAAKSRRRSVPPAGRCRRR